MRYKTKCPNCKAMGVTLKDHDRADAGMTGANRWLCDTFSVDEDEGDYPNFHLTSELAQLIQEGIRTSPYREFRDLGKVFDL